MPVEFSIDLSTLPPPTIVEQLSFEAIVAAMIADLRSRDPVFTALVESDPAYKVIEVCAFRELLLRQRVNEAALGVMLAYAIGSDLDQEAARWGVLRGGTAATLQVGTGDAGVLFTARVGGAATNAISLVIVAAGAANSLISVHVNSLSAGPQIVVTLASDASNVIATTVAQLAAAVNASPTASALVKATLTGTGASLASVAPLASLAGGIDETDTALRARTQLALQGFSCAGPKGAYKFFALSVPGVGDVSVQGPTDDPDHIPPGTVVIAVLGATGTGALPDPDPATANESGESPILASVRAALNAEDVRPLTDTVIVKSATIVNFTVVASIFTYPGPDPSTVVAAAVTAVNAFLASNKKLGRTITRAGIIAALYQSGAQNVVLTQPAADVACTAAQAGNCTAVTVTFGGTGT